MKRTYTTESIPYELEKDRSRAYLAPAALRACLLKPGTYICITREGRSTVLKAVPKFDGDESSIYLPLEEIKYLEVPKNGTVSIEKDTQKYKDAECISVSFPSVKKTAEALETIKITLADKKVVRDGEVFFGGVVNIKSSVDDLNLTNSTIPKIARITENTKIRVISEEGKDKSIYNLEKEKNELCNVIIQAYASKEDKCKGVLVTGEVGMGKRQVCRAALKCTGQDWVVAKANAASVKNIIEAYAYAKSNEPCTVWIDRVDRLFTEEKIHMYLPEIETIFEDIKQNKRRICVLATAISGASIPADIRTSSFFEKEIVLAAPVLAQRREQIDRWIRENAKNNSCNCTDDVVEEAAKKTAGFSRDSIYLILKNFTEDKTDIISIDNKNNIFSSEEDIGKRVERMGVTTTYSTNNKNSSNRLSQPNTNTYLLCGSSCLKALLMRIIRVPPSASNEKPIEVPDIRFSSVLGQQEAKEQLTEAVIWPVIHANLFADMGMQVPKGVLLYGPPGCGKTLLAQALANESGAVFLSVRGPEIMGKYVGESEQRLRKIFAQARENTPAIVFIDEIDSIAPHRETEGGQVDKRVVSTLLTEMDGVGASAGVFVLGATNKPWSIDSALLRPGRFDCHLLVGLPEEETRKSMLTQRIDKIFSAVEKWAPNTKITEEEKKNLLLFLVEHTNGFTAAEMVGLCNNLCISAIRTKISDKNTCFSSLISQLIKEAEKVAPRVSSKEIALFTEYKKKTDKFS